MNNEINRKYSDIKKQCYCIENNLLPKEIYKLESKVWTLNLLVTIINEAIWINESFPGSSVSKESSCNAEGPGLITTLFNFMLTRYQMLIKNTYNIPLQRVY